MRPFRLNRQISITAPLFWLLVLSPMLDAAPPDLFEPTGVVAGGVPLGPEVVRVNLVSVRLDVLESAKVDGRLSFSVDENGPFIGVVERIERRADDRFTVSGRIDDVEFGSFVFVREQNALAGFVDVPTLPRIFRLHDPGDGQSAIIEIDPRRYPQESPPLVRYDGPIAVTPVDAVPIDEEGANDRESSAGAVAGGCANTGPVFDVLIVWTPAAQAAAGSTDAIRAEAITAIQRANIAYDNSNINARFRLVHSQEMAFNETGLDIEQLASLINPVDGNGDAVHGLRNTHNADFVQLLGNNISGIGFCSAGTETAYTIARWDLAADNFTFVHEIGHNMGCSHNREDAGAAPCGAQPYAYGWRWFGNSGDGWRSVMSYDDSAGNYTRVGVFSNPNVFVDGQPSGVPIGDPNQAHNAAAINLAPAFYEAFRITRYDVWVDFAMFPSGNGTFQLPYDNLASGADAIGTGSGASELPSLWVKSGSSDETIRITKPMRLRNCGGDVRIGDVP